MDPMTQPRAFEPEPQKKPRVQRARPSKSLPSDRMKFEVQVRVLQAFGRLGTDGRVIEAERLSDAISNEVSKYTVTLSHGFFVESGWLNKANRGEYTVTDALTTYSRKVSAGADDPTASLRMTAESAWYWRVIEPLLRHGDANISEVMVAIMQEAEVGQAHRPQIRMVLEWLKFIGLIRMTDDKVVRVGAAPEASYDDEIADLGPEPIEEPSAPDPETEAAPTPVPVVDPRAEVPRPTTTRASQPRPLLSFDFSCTVTAEDLAKLDAEQIKALFEAVGTVAAITGTRG